MKPAEAPDAALIVVVRCADSDDLTHDRRSWRMPCAFCGSVCWVDPESLHGSKFVGLGDGIPATIADPADRRLCCLQCALKMAGIDP